MDRYHQGLSGNVHSTECLVRSLAYLYGYVVRQKRAAEERGDSEGLLEAQNVLANWDKFCP